MTTFNTKVARRLTSSIKLVAATLALPVSLGVSSAHAAGYAGTQFEIEMVVFSRSEGMNASRETWPTSPRLTYDSRWVDFNTPSKNDPMVPVLQPVANQLNNKVAALSRDPGYKVLFHKTWRQVLQTERNAPAVLISGGEASDNHHQLEGSVTLSVSRYLHLSTDLWLSEWANQSGYGNGNAQWSSGQSQSNASTPTAGIPVPARPRAAIAPRESTLSEEPMGLASTAQQAADSEQAYGYSNTANGSFSTSANNAVFHGDDNNVDLPLEKIADKVAVLQEERRLRSGELHYIDHPKLGVLIEVRTVSQTPADEIEPTGLTE